MGDSHKMGYLMSVLGTLLLLTNMILFFTSHQISNPYQKSFERKKRSSESVSRSVADDRIKELIERKFLQLDATLRRLESHWHSLNSRIEKLEIVKEVTSNQTNKPNNQQTNSLNHSIALGTQPIAVCGTGGCYFTRLQNVTAIKCGGVINADSGAIQYKLNETYNDNEYCAWTILTEGSSLEFNLTKYGFFYSYDGITLLNINPDTGDLQKLETFHWKFQYPVQTFKTNSSHAIVIFSSNGHYKGQGFELQFKAVGQRNPDVMYTAAHHTRTGPLIIQESYGRSFKAFYRIITQSSSETDAIFSATTTRGVLFQLNKSCEYEKFKAYELIEGTHLHQLGELSTSADKINCPSSVPIQVPSPWFKSSTGANIVVMRVIPEILTTLTTVKEKRDMSISTACGGWVVGDSGYISYKEDAQYENNVNCTWHINSKTLHSKIHFTVEKEGFELCCDHLAVEMSNGTTRWLSTRPSRESNTERSVILYEYSGTSVTFTSNGNNPGTGFRLRYKMDPLQTSHQSYSDSKE